jgi:hypothetical protein
VNTITEPLEFGVILLGKTTRQLREEEKTADIIEMLFDYYLPEDWSRVGECYLNDKHQTIGAICSKEMEYAL